MSNILPTAFQQTIHMTKYSRWIEEEERRESWEETVNRYVNFIYEQIEEHNDYALPDHEIEELRSSILNAKVMPSMRALMTAGPAAERDNISTYNCSFIAVDTLRAFDEAMYILMNGTGVGFSVESQYVSQLPAVAEHFEASETVIKVADSKAGWARAFKELLAMLWSGQIPTFDTSDVRPRGARLKTFGGRASGPEPLVGLFDFAIDLVTKAAGRKLTSIEAHDLMCKVGEIVVVGGVRRSALISLSDLGDRDMAKAKSGAWW